MITTSELPPGWVVCESYPEPGQTIMLWHPAVPPFQTGSWVPARVRDRRLRGGHGREVLPDGSPTGFPVQGRPPDHYAIPGDHPVTPSDTNPAARHTPTTNNHHPCTCGHSPHQHTTQNGQPICLICTTKTGHGCRGYITDRTPDPAERDAFLAGFTEGEDWALRGPHATPVHEAAEHAYTQWINNTDA